MKKTILIISQVILISILCTTADNTWSQNNFQIHSEIRKDFTDNIEKDFTDNIVKDFSEKPEKDFTDKPEKIAYKYPEFYRGIYLNIYSARSFEKLSKFIKEAKAANVNSLVLDIHFPRKIECEITSVHVDMCIKNGLHPIARIVVFQDGLKKYPVSENEIEEKLKLAENACEIGFKEIQFDYIRFTDTRVMKHLSRKERYSFIEGFLQKAGERLKKYDAIIAADVFGRIPLNRGDAIGQRIEGLDNVVDIICPMAYPSHYTWSKKMMSNPYYTVLLTSKSAKERTDKAHIVTYIQAFKMKLSASKLTFEKYIEEQLRAVHDSGIRGYILWNASQKYETPFNVLKDFYKERSVTADTKDEKDRAS